MATISTAQEVDKDGFRIVYESGIWSVRQGFGECYISGKVYPGGSLYEIPAGEADGIYQHLTQKKWFEPTRQDFENALKYWRDNVR